MNYIVTLLLYSIYLSFISSKMVRDTPASSELTRTDDEPVPSRQEAPRYTFDTDYYSSIDDVEESADGYSDGGVHTDGAEEEGPDEGEDTGGAEEETISAKEDGNGAKAK